ncbi:hypothetical protein LTR04_003025 [Oleoguttula sp. CCFEE 6159]|nr:hypothetical protein LTR04_003025 [Oleoguttula sp. CCFEE 6159]
MTSATTHTLTIKPLATLTPSSTSRAWSSAPHPYLPILATACSDKTVRIYSLTSFTHLSTISGGHKRSIRSCAWKPGVRNESVLATGSFDASAGIWRRWEEGSGAMKEDAEPVDFTNGVKDDDEEEEDEEWRFAVVLDGHESEIKSLAWSAGGQFLATCSRDKSVWIWEEMEDDNFETIAVLQDHEGDVKCVAWHPEEELLASASYDDTIRLWREDLDDWTCVSVLNGHEATVWYVDFEPVENASLVSEQTSQPQQALLDARKQAGPRLISCSDDLTIRVWKRNPKQKTEVPTGQGRMPSIFKNNSIEEDWVQEAQLPRVHDRAIYTAAWSKRTGRVVSTGSDGKIVVYQEKWTDTSNLNGNGHAASGRGGEMSGGDTVMTDATGEDSGSPLTEWVVVAELDGAHDVFEVNHVCWAKRCDKGGRNDAEEVIVSTGDDGEVKVWTIEEP